ncbi:MAG TPA: isochorismatase family protein [Candidatus Limnocylindrales bacterium]
MQRYDAATALVVVDVQNDFADPRGSLAVDGGPRIVPFINEQIAAARHAGAFVVYTQDWHPEHTPHFERDGGIWPVHCVHDTWGAALHEALTVDGPVVRKGVNGEDGYSAFTMRDPVSDETVPTELESLLRDRAIRTVVAAGLATDYCIKATVLDAIRLGFTALVLADGIRAVEREPGDGDVAIAEMEAAGATLVHEYDDGRVHHEQEL